MRPDGGFLSLSTDFGPQTQSVGVLEATVIGIAPETRVVHLTHSLPPFEVAAAARAMESLYYVPVGVHVCVCDPGVGGGRRAIVLKVGRGDLLVGPDNGVFLPAARLLGGIVSAWEIVNPDFMREPISPIFHGRDVFVSCAAHIVSGEWPDAVGPALGLDGLAAAPYEEALVVDGIINAEIITVNRYGSVHLNVLHQTWDDLGLPLGAQVDCAYSAGRRFRAVYARTFSDVAQGSIVALRDDYGRVELAENLGNLAERFNLRLGDGITIRS